ncbi:hypothetical protein BLNAU_10582 [Blattamonas nauphoetae]|uniref:Protein kinase domain-containing protein n=1 Tax=Blattamonas nauphoetae TaxID=2049346 RepID=A0ABQ9XSN3_9EUKA|nr:hypothetical protein BLNAU_10582 [Blattamonas nauphoetae]
MNRSEPVVDIAVLIQQATLANSFSTDTPSVVLPSTSIVSKSHVFASQILYLHVVHSISSHKLHNCTTIAAIVLAGCSNLPQGTSSVLLSDLEISHCKLAGPVSLIGTSLGSLQLSSCTFHNISQSTLTRPRTGSPNPGQTTRISNTTFSDVENGLYGSIFDDMNDNNEVHVYFSTFLRNTHTNAEGYTTEYTTTQTSSESQSTSFTSCFFNKCTASGTNGGAIYHTSSYDLSVQTCMFESCSAGTAQTLYEGGGIFISQTTSRALSFENVIFRGCSGHFGGGMSIKLQNALILNSFSMTYCTFHDNSAYWGGGMRLYHLKNPTISHCTFTNNHADYLESGFGLRNTVDLVSITNVSMIDGTAPNNVFLAFDSHTGSYRLSSLHMADFHSITTRDICAFGQGNTYTSDTDKTPLLFSNCLVETRHNSDPLDLTANGVPIVVCYTNLLITEDMFEDCWTTSMQWSVTIARVDDTPFKHSWIPNPSVTMSTTHGVDEPFCWKKDSKCSTLTDLVWKRIETFFDGKIEMEEGEYEETDVAVWHKTLTIEGVSKEAVRICDVGSTTSLFTILSGSLDGSQLTFIPSLTSSLIALDGAGSLTLTDCLIDGLDLTPDSILSVPLISLSAGTATFNELTISNLVFSDAAAIKSTNALSLTISQSSFKNITRKAGSGVAISAVVPSASFASVTLSNFTDCHSLDEDFSLDTEALDDNYIATDRGGIVRLVGASSSSKGSAEVSDCRFSDCSAFRGCGVGVHASTLDTLSTTSNVFSSLSGQGQRARGAALQISHCLSASVLATTFSDCSMKGHLPGTYAGGLYSISTRLSLDGCLFERCSCEYYISATILSDLFDQSVVKNTIFSECSTPSMNANVLHIMSSAGTTLQNCSFVDNFAGDGTTTPALIFLGQGTPNKITISDCYAAAQSQVNSKGQLLVHPNWQSPTTVIENNLFLMASPAVNSSEFNDGASFPTLRVSKATTSTSSNAEVFVWDDTSMCGHPSKKCRTAAFAVSLSLCTVGGDVPVVIVLDDETHPEGPITVGSKLVQLTGQNGKQVTTILRQTTAASLLSVGDGSLWLSELTVSTQSCVSPCISTGGTLALSKISFFFDDHDGSSDAPLISVTDGAATLSSCKFGQSGKTLPTTLFAIDEGGNVACSDANTITNPSLSTALSTIVGSLTISGTALSHTTVVHSDGARTAALFEVTGGVLSLSFVTIPAISLSSEVSLVSASNRASVEIASMSFLDTSNGGTGAILKSADASKVILNDVNFTNCNSASTSAGRAVWISKDAFAAGDVEMKSVCVSHTTSSSVADVLLVGSNIASVVTSTSFASSFVAQSSMSKSEMWKMQSVVENTPSESGPLAYFFYPRTTEDIRVEAGFWDHSKCGLEELPCSSLSHAFAKQTTPNGAVLVCSNLSLASMVAVSVAMSFKSTLDSSPTVSLAADAGFVVTASFAVEYIMFVSSSMSLANPVFSVQSTGSLSLLSCEFGLAGKTLATTLFAIDEGGNVACSDANTITNPSLSTALSTIVGSLTISGTALSHTTVVHSDGARTAALFEVTGGVLSLSFVTIPAISLSSEVSLVSASNRASVEIASMSFLDTSNGGTGAILKSADASKVILNDVNFTNCNSASTSAGRAVWISKDAFAAGDVEMKSVCVSHTTSSSVADVLLVGSNIASVVTSTSFASSFVAQSSMSKSEMWKMQSVVENTPSESGPLAYFFYPRTTEDIRVEAGFWDHSKCGLEELPCSSLSHAFAKQTTPNGAVLVCSNLSLASMVAVSVAMSFKSTLDSSPTVSLAADAGFVVTASFAVEYIMFVSSSMSLANPVFSVQSTGSLSLLSCEFGLAGKTLATTLFAIDEGGNVACSDANTITNPSLSTALSTIVGSLTISGTALSHTTVVHSDGARTAALFEVTGGVLSLSFVTIPAISLSSEVSLVSASNRASVEIASMSFLDTSNGGTGAILKSADASKVILNDVNFTNCNSASTSAGRAVWISKDAFAAGDVEMKSVCVSHTTSSSVADVLLVGSNIASVVTSTSFASSFVAQSSMSKSEMWKMQSVVENTPSESGPLAYFFYPRTTEDIRVEAGFWDHSKCGLEELPCSSLSHAFAKQTTPNGAVLVCSNLSLASMVAVSVAMSFKSTLDSSPTVSLAADAGFVVTASFTVASLVFISSAEFHKKPVLAVQSAGSLSLSKSEFESFTLSANPLILHKSDTLQLSSCTFTDITRLSGNGSVLQSHLTNGMKLLVNNITLLRVTTKTGFGDGLFIWLDGPYTDFVGEDLILRDLSLGETLHETERNSRNAEEAKEPCYVWLLGSDFSNIVSTGDSRFSWKNTEVVDKWIWTDDITSFLPASLLFYLKEGTGPIGVDDSGYQISKCGYFGVWCANLTYSMNRRPSSVSQFLVKEALTTAEQIEVTNTLELIGNANRPTVLLNTNTVISTTSDASLVITQLLISLKHNPNASPIISHASTGILTLDDVIFDCEGHTLSSTLLSASAGQVHLLDMEFTTAQLTGGPLLTFSVTTTIENCNFSSISHSSTHYLIESTISPIIPLKITNTIFTSEGDTNTCWVLIHGTNEETFSAQNWEGTYNTLKGLRRVLVEETSSVWWKDNTTLNPYPLQFAFTPRKDVVFVSGEGFDHPLCGNEKSACLTIEGGVAMTKGRRVEVNGTGTITSLMNLDGDFLAVSGHKSHSSLVFTGNVQIVNNEFVEPDELSLSKLTVSIIDSNIKQDNALIEAVCGTVVLVNLTITSTKALNSSLVSIQGSSVDLEMEKITVSIPSFSAVAVSLPSFHSASFIFVAVQDSQADTFISASASASIPQLTFHSCSFIGTATPSNSDDSLCSFSSGFLVLDHCQTTIHSSEFGRLSNGAIQMVGGSLSLIGSLFTHNTPHNSSFPSARRNINCEEEGNITILTGSQNMDSDTTSKWISGSSCRVEEGESVLKAPFFIPTMNADKCNVVHNVKNKTNKFFTVTVQGELLIPCGLDLEVFEWITTKTTSQEGNSTTLILTDSSITSWNESLLSFSAQESVIALDATHEWRARLLFGDGERTSNWVRLKVSESAAKLALTKQAMKWIIPVAASFLALLLILVIVFVICRRRKQKGDTKRTELKEIDEPELLVKYEPGDNHDPNQIVAFCENQETQSTCIGVAAEPTKSAVVFPPSTAPIMTHQVMKCDGDYELTYAAGVTSLYDLLHGAQHQRILQKRLVRMQLVRGLKRLVVENKGAAGLLHLSPHSIFVDGTDQCFLDLAPELKQETRRGNAETAQSQATSRPSLRWEAPEVAKDQPNVDGHKAAVFSLGLVLWELENEEVPWWELDAMNAQRRYDANCFPDTHFISDEKMRKVIASCLTLNPDERPTLQEVSEALEANTRNNTNTVVKEPWDVGTSAADDLKHITQ